MSFAVAVGVAGSERRVAGRNGGSGGGGMGAVTPVTLAQAVTSFPLACEGLAPLINAAASAHGLRELLKQAAFQAKEAIEEATKVWNVKSGLGSSRIGGSPLVVYYSALDSSAIGCRKKCANSSRVACTWHMLLCFDLSPLPSIFTGTVFVAG